MEKKRSLHLFLLLSILCALVSTPYFVLANSNNTQSTYAQKAQQLLNQMTPEEKVGQLFLITFQGSTLSEESELFALMQDYQIGGVILSRADDNFSGPQNTVESATALITQLQQKNWEYAQLSSKEEKEEKQKAYIPLFIGISQDGDSFPFDQILSGISTLPNQMAIGATFSTDLAKASGELLGRELKACGFNLYLGPSLDVLDASYSASGASLGTRTYGGDPYWVGELGKSFISGLHVGSNTKIAVIAKHFPGRGSSDRLPEEEVATVRKSLEQLKLIELAPFFAASTLDPNEPTTTSDGFLVSHIRYQGFQGNIRETTKPVSFDSSALNSILNLAQFTAWRNAGGILVSDSLGGKAIRGFFDPDNKNFDGKQIALNAFLAGNDLLYLDDFQSTNDANEMITVRATLDLFAQKYHEDNAFAERVDESVLRILTLKFKIYDIFSLSSILPQQEQLGVLGQGHDVLSKIARNAATLINPSVEELSSILPDPPSSNDRIIFLTDTISAAQCSTCEEEEIFSANALEETVLRLYGESGTGQILKRHLNSLSFNDLSEYLDNSSSRADVGSAISEANWVVFSILDIDKERPSSNALKRLLTENPGILHDKNVIVFAFNVPFYLDATDLTYIDAYYCLYSKTDEFIETAARLLFQEVVPKGHSPVSIPVVGYDLIEMTYPDPSQTIPLAIDSDNLSESKKTESKKSGVENLVFKVGDILPIKAGPILDRNGLIVPDGTVVYFLIDHMGEKEQSTIIQAQTKGGIASMSYPIQSYGRVEIRVQSDPAKNSDIFILDIVSEEGSVLSQITPTSLPTQLNPTEFVSQKELTGTSAPQEKEEKTIPGLIQWFLISIVILASSYACYSLTHQYVSFIEGASIAFYAVISGYACFLWFQLGLPGSFHCTNFLELIYLILWVILFVGVGAGIGIGIQRGFFKKLSRELNKKTDKKAQ